MIAMSGVIYGKILKPPAYKAIPSRKGNTEYTVPFIKITVKISVSSKGVDDTFAVAEDATAILFHTLSTFAAWHLFLNLRQFDLVEIFYLFSFCCSVGNLSAFRDVI